MLGAESLPGSSIYKLAYIQTPEKLDEQCHTQKILSYKVSHNIVYNFVVKTPTQPQLNLR